LVLGAASVYALTELITKWGIFREVNLIESDFWFITLFTLCLLPDVFNIGFRRRWGAWALVIFLAVGAAIRSVGYFASGEIWTSALAAWVYVGDVVVFGALAVSFPVAIAMRTPGCEFNAIPRLVARVRGTRGRGDAALPPWRGPVRQATVVDLGREDPCRGGRHPVSELIWRRGRRVPASWYGSRAPACRRSIAGPRHGCMTASAQRASRRALSTTCGCGPSR